MPVQISPDKRTNGFKISTQAFKPRKKDEGVSVDVEDLRLRDGFATSKKVPHLRHVLAVLRVQVSDVNKLKYAVEHRPVPRDLLRLMPANPYHAEIELGQPKVGELKKLLQICQIAVPLEQAEAEALKTRFDRLGIR